MYGARPVYTHHARNFVLLPNARIGQIPTTQGPGPISVGPMQGAPLTPVPGQSAPIRADEPIPAEPRVHIAWGPLIFASLVGGAAFAFGAGFINKYVWQK